MIPDPLLQSIGQFGLEAVIIGILLWQIFFLQKKLISIIENNTAALTKNTETSRELVQVNNDLKETVKDCQRHQEVYR